MLDPAAKERLRTKIFCHGLIGCDNFLIMANTYDDKPVEPAGSNCVRLQRSCGQSHQRTD